MQSKVVTVTLNPALDKTITIPQLEVGGLNRVEQVRLDPGGKGINVAKVLKKFSVDVIATGFLGSEGEFLQRSLQKLGIKTDFINVPGVTRTNLKIVDNQTKFTTEINELGFVVLDEHLASFRKKLRHLLQNTAVLVLGGSLPRGVPPTIYADYISLAREYNVKTILDADGLALEEGIKACPFAVKPNVHELAGLMGRPLTTEKEIVAAGQELIKAGITIVVISRGSEGTIAMAKDEAYIVTPFSIIPQSTVGAGDSMVAAMAYAILQNKSLVETARLATVAGTVTASKPGTEVCSLNEVQLQLNKVQATWIEP
ncbi:1-phosphofructokinase [Desulforamulus hydrothermalis]|nr:1-phosphofructokinase [Desulforamulus hydrothermalis]SHH16879.1 1-phosphofructokinase [Desulforamulus hydrothermalis Lam5 = DSM 18033]